MMNHFSHSVVGTVLGSEKYKVIHLLENHCGRIEMTSLKFKEYRQMNGQSLRLMCKAGQGKFLRRFDKTLFPVKETDVVCPHFMLLAWANGCPYNCAWTHFCLHQEPAGPYQVVMITLMMETSPAKPPFF
jgi:hypothetical protein